MVIKLYSRMYKIVFMINIDLLYLYNTELGEKRSLCSIGSAAFGIANCITSLSATIVMPFFGICVSMFNLFRYDYPLNCYLSLGFHYFFFSKVLLIVLEGVIIWHPGWILTVGAFLCKSLRMNVSSWLYLSLNQLFFCMKRKLNWQCRFFLSEEGLNFPGDWHPCAM